MEQPATSEVAPDLFVGRLVWRHGKKFVKQSRSSALELADALWRRCGHSVPVRQGDDRLPQAPQLCGLDPGTTDRRVRDDRTEIGHRRRDLDDRPVAALIDEFNCPFALKPRKNDGHRSTPRYACSSASRREGSSRLLARNAFTGMPGQHIAKSSKSIRPIEPSSNDSGSSTKRSFPSAPCTRARPTSKVTNERMVFDRGSLLPDRSAATRASSLEFTSNRIALSTGASSS